MSLIPGARVGYYEVLSGLGAGGMGEVFRPRDTKLNREVALKGLPDSGATNANRLARFERGAIRVTVNWFDELRRLVPAR